MGYQLRGTWQCWLVLALPLLLFSVRGIHAEENPEYLRQLLESQNKQLQEQQQQLQEMQQRVDALSAGLNLQPTSAAQPGSNQGSAPNPLNQGGQPNAPPGGGGQSGPGTLPGGIDEPAPSPINPDAMPGGLATVPPMPADTPLKRNIDSYIRGNPGIGLPAGVQTGYSNGFYIRSTRDPGYVKWGDLSGIPFELRFRGQMQFLYAGYKVDDKTNHSTGVSTPTASSADFSQLEIKRARIIMDGSAFDPNLKFRLTFDGNTRGLTTLAGGNGFTGAAGAIPGVPGPPGVAGGQPVGLTDNAVRFFQGWVSYDFHPWKTQKGCGPDCVAGSYSYAATFRPIIGKMQPFFGLEEVLGSANEQFVEFSMADWFFDADDNNQLTGAGFQYQDFDDRLFVQGLITNGNDSQIANQLMQRLPGFMLGGWYDFGGSWNRNANRWNLFGDSISDIDWSVNPTLRVGGAANIVPGDRRSQYTTATMNRIRLMPAAIGGPPIENILNGGLAGTLTAAGVSPFALDAVDEYSYDTFAAFHFRGLSIYNEWWLRNLNNFRGIKPLGAATGNPTLYNSVIGGKTALSLYPNGGTIDFGSAITVGYFIIPKKMELAVRFDFVTGESGAVNGNGTFSTTTVPGITGPVRVVNQAFRTFSTAREYAVAFNYYFYRQLVKWQTDVSWYQGGNPAAGAQSPAAFLPGVDGYAVRSQIQLAF